jgi:hypothetical protein
LSEINTTAATEVDVTYKHGTVDEFREVSEFNNDGAHLTFKGRKRDADGKLGPMSTWWIPVTDNVRSVATRETTADDGT